jgi:hypothetical protein
MNGLRAAEGQRQGLEHQPLPAIYSGEDGRAIKPAELTGWALLKVIGFQTVCSRTAPEVSGFDLYWNKMERETGFEAPSTNQCVEFDYRLGN